MAALPRLVLLAVLSAASFAKGEVRRFTVAGRPVVVSLPAALEGPWPVVYLMGGMGELSRGEAVSAGAWVDDYRIEAVVQALEAGRVTDRTLQGLSTPSELRDVRARLARLPYRGLVLVGLPAPVDYTDAFEKFVLQDVLPWAERTLPIRPGAASRGIDGVSLGGRHALRLGLRNPGVFRSVGAVQGAVRGYRDAVLEWSRAADAQTGQPRPKLNLSTSDGDPYRGAIEGLGKDLRARGFDVRISRLTGPHDYVFNRGPGALDLLLFHDSVLNAQP